MSKTLDMTLLLDNVNSQRRTATQDKPLCRQDPAQLKHLTYSSEYLRCK